MGTRAFLKHGEYLPIMRPSDRGHRDIFGGDDPPPAPDYAPMAAASDRAAELGLTLGREQLAETQRQYNINRGVSDRVSNSQIALMDQARTQGDDYYNYMVQNQRPVENALNQQSMRDTSGQEAADRAQIQGLYEQGIGGAEQGRQDIMGRYNANEQQDRVGQQQILDTRTRGADQALGVQGQMYGLSQQQAAANVAQRQGMLDLTGQNTAAQAQQRAAMQGLTSQNAAANVAGRQGMLDLSQQNDVENTAQRAQMLALRNQGYDVGEGMRQGMAARYQQNDAQNAQEAALLAGGDTGIYNARQADIEAGVGRAAADARSGQSSTTNQMIRQALRYGYSPNKLAALAGAQGLGQASQVAAASNAARQQGIESNRGYLQQGYNLRNASTDQYMNYAGADRNAAMLNYENRAGAVGANADQRNAAYAQRYGALGAAYDQGNAAYAQQYGAAGDIYDRGNAAYQQQYGAQGAAYDQGNAAFAQQYGAMDANRTGFLQDADARANALGTAYDQRNATNAAMLQGLTNNRQMGLDQSQMRISGAMNNRNLALQDSANAWGKKLDVAGLYRGMPGASQGAYGVSTNAGNSALGNTMAPGNSLLTGMAQGAGMQQTGAGQQMTGLGSILNAQNAYNNIVTQTQAANAQGMAGLGKLAGTAAALYFSDRRLKKNIERVGTDTKTGLGLYEFNYVVGDDNLRYRGVMADEVREIMPDAVYRVSGYDYVNYDMLGISMVEV